MYYTMQRAINFIAEEYKPPVKSKQSFEIRADKVKSVLFCSILSELIKIYFENLFFLSKIFTLLSTSLTRLRTAQFPCRSHQLCSRHRFFLLNPHKNTKTSQAAAAKGVTNAIERDGGQKASKLTNISELDRERWDKESNEARQHVRGRKGALVLVGVVDVVIAVAV